MAFHEKILGIRASISDVEHGLCIDRCLGENGYVHIKKKKPGGIFFKVLEILGPIFRWRLQASLHGHVQL